jgi:hypothetical protein
VRAKHSYQSRRVPLAARGQCARAKPFLQSRAREEAVTIPNRARLPFTLRSKVKGEEAACATALERC